MQRGFVAKDLSPAEVGFGSPMSGDEQLTLKQCRDLISKGSSLSDTEVALLRSQACVLADIITAAFKQERDRKRKQEEPLGSITNGLINVYENAQPVAVQ